MTDDSPASPLAMTLPMAKDPRRELAEFLRTRRTRVRPQDVGLEPGPRRRVASGCGGRNWLCWRG
ncbi:hypothetical protein OHS59_43705 [Streptomyces sp. NBC_00414]|uniref:hypothetical protein n=1 Tax=Streptomyces sp. NBC_00414 TaxID=2975739 RepID=UPI002E1DC7E2